MSTRTPSLASLQAFDAAVRHMSFTKSAEELHRTQSAISKQIGRLEEILGVALFTRKTRDLHLTEAGRTFYKKVSVALDTLDSAIREMQSLKDNIILTISMPPTYAAHGGMSLVTRFQRAHQHIDVRISINTAGVIKKQRDVDFTIEYIHKNTCLDDHQLIFEEMLIPVCSPEYFQARNKETLLEDSLLLHCEQFEGMYTDWDEWLRSFGRPDLSSERGSVYGTIQLAVDAAIAGAGIALCEYRFIQDYLEKGMLVAPIEHLLPTGRAYYYRLGNNEESQAGAEMFATWMDIENHPQT